MDRAPRATSSPWDPLRRNLKGSFSARARGFLAAEFTLLDPDGEEFGRLHPDGTSSAVLDSGGYASAFEASGKSYRMVTDGEEVLTAVPKRRSIDELEISCGGQTYGARVSFLRNLAVASSPDDERAVRLSGGLVGRSYEALFATQDVCALPIAVFLLWHLAANRRRVFQAGGGAM